MPFSKKITDRQLALLCDLAALEDAGFIDPGGDRDLVEVDQGNHVLEVPGTVTAEGHQLISEFKRSGRTISL